MVKKVSKLQTWVKKINKIVQVAQNRSKYFARADPMNLAQFLNYKFGAWCSHASELGTSNALSSAHQHGIISTKPKGLCYAFNII